MNDSLSSTFLVNLLFLFFKTCRDDGLSNTSLVNLDFSFFLRRAGMMVCQMRSWLILDFFPIFKDVWGVCHEYCQGSPSLLLIWQAGIMPPATSTQWKNKISVPLHSQHMH